MQNRTKISTQPEIIPKIPEPKPDDQYFQSLTHYKPLFYAGKGTPVFLMNQDWQSSFYCVGCMDVIVVAVLVLFIINAESNQAKLQQQGLSPKLAVMVSVAIFLIAHISLILTQFLNPGITNPSNLPIQHPQADLTICRKCQNFRTEQMRHCDECGVCVWGLDHHCGFFNKCIAGYQKWAFYCCLTFGFLAFVDLIMLVGCLVV